MAKMFAIKGPSGVLLCNTASSSRAGAWDSAYHKYLRNVRQYFLSHNPTKAAYAKGWRCVEVTVKEVK